MVLTPLAIAAVNLVRGRVGLSADGYERPSGLAGTALIIGFGRVGQIASQFLLARGYDITIIDTDVEMIDAARDFEFKVYYGDGTRLDILHVAGAGRARVVLVCVDKAADGTGITELVKSEFPLVPVLARATDRLHSMDLISGRGPTGARDVRMRGCPRSGGSREAGHAGGAGRQNHGARSGARSAATAARARGGSRPFSGRRGLAAPSGAAEDS